MSEPDQIDMMEEWELRAELRIVVQKLREAQERCARLEGVGLKVLKQWREEACDSFGTPDMPLEEAWTIDDPKGYALWKELRAALSEPDEMTHDESADTTDEGGEMSEQRRNLNPHKAAVAAIFLWDARYAAQLGDSMDFWDSLSDNEKRICRDLVRHVEQARPE